jgi:predicted nuclease of restriction endonuclease-like (RecB) superfamily
MLWVLSASRTSLTQKKKTKKKESPTDRAKMKRMQGFCLLFLNYKRSFLVLKIENEKCG